RRHRLHRGGLHDVAAAHPPRRADRARAMTITGVIQAGGKSTRMGGEPKALMELGGRRVIDRVVDVLASVTDDLLVVTNTPELYASLGGIYSGLKAAGAAIFTVACDMPFLRPDVARLVIGRAEEADVVVPRAGG